MTTGEPTAGSIVHVELYSDDPEATRGFYEAAFGWTFEPVEDLEYTTWMAPDRPHGGLMARDDAPADLPSTMFYIDVDDIEAFGNEVTAAGGELLIEAMAVPEVGVFSVFRDPGGVIEAAWEERYEGEMPAEGWPAFSDDPSPGSIVHFELYSDDPSATQSFHEAVFGWSFDADGGGEYTMIEPPTSPAGGLLAANEAMPAGTLAYLLVDSVEDSVQTIQEAGGQLIREPVELEGWGTMAVFEAPGGIVQAMWETRPEARQAPDVAEGEPLDRSGD